MPASLTAFISDLYVNERKKDKEAGEDSAQVYASARTLLSILRLATACARIRFSPAVSKEDVMESMRLMRMSKSSLEASMSAPVADNNTDGTSGVYLLIRKETIRSGNAVVRVADVKEQILAAGYSQETLDTTLTEYATLNVWMLNRNSTVITFL